MSTTTTNIPLPVLPNSTPPSGGLLLPLPPREKCVESTDLANDVDSTSISSSSGSPKASYKARRNRAKERKINSGRQLRMTTAVGPHGQPIDVCCDVAFERVTSKRTPKILTDEDVARLMNLSDSGSRIKKKVINNTNLKTTNATTSSTIIDSTTTTCSTSKTTSSTT